MSETPAAKLEKDLKLGADWRRALTDHPYIVALFLAVPVFGVGHGAGYYSAKYLSHPVVPCGYHVFRIPRAQWGTGVGETVECEGRTFEITVREANVEGEQGKPEPGFVIRFRDRTVGTETELECTRDYDRVFINYKSLGPLVTNEPALICNRPDDVLVEWDPVVVR